MGLVSRLTVIYCKLKLVPFVDLTNAHYGQLLIEKQPAANQCHGPFFIQVGTTRHH